MQKKFHILFLALLTPTQSVGGEYPYTFRHAYFLGRGDTGIAYCDNEAALFYNPAGVAFGTGIYKQIILASPHLEVSSYVKDVAREIALQGHDPTLTLKANMGKVQHTGLSNYSGIILRRAAIGAYATSRTNLLLGKDPERGSFERIDAESLSDVGAIFSLGERMGMSNFYYGGSLRYFKRAQAAFSANATDTSEVANMKDSDTLAMVGQASAVDLGLLYREDRPGKSEWAFGLTVGDVGDTHFTPDNVPTIPKDKQALKTAKQTLNFGTAYVVGTKTSKFRILLDLRDLTNVYDDSPYKKVHIGGELAVRNVVGMTVGINQGYPTVGFYVNLRVLRLDVGSYTEEFKDKVGMRPDSRIFFRLFVGL